MRGPSRVVRWVLRGFIAALGFAAGAVLVLAVVDQAERVEPARDDTGDVDAAAARVGLLIERHDCWTDDVPPEYEGELPGGVVVTRGDRTFYSTDLVGPALDQVFDHRDAGLTVHAFCPGRGPIRDGERRR